MLYLVNIVFPEVELPEGNRVTYQWIYRSWLDQPRGVWMLLKISTKRCWKFCTTTDLLSPDTSNLHQSHCTAKVMFFPRVGGYWRSQMIILNITFYPMPSTQQCFVGYHCKQFLAKDLQLVPSWILIYSSMHCQKHITHLCRSCFLPQNIHLNTYIYIYIDR